MCHIGGNSSYENCSFYVTQWFYLNGNNLYQDRHLITNHHILPVDFFHIRNWRNKLTRQKKTPKLPPKTPHQQKTLKSLYSELSFSQKGMQNLSLYKLTQEGGTLQVMSNTVYSVHSFWKREYFCCIKTEAFASPVRPWSSESPPLLEPTLIKKHDGSSTSLKTHSPNSKSTFLLSNNLFLCWKCLSEMNELWQPTWHLWLHILPSEQWLCGRDSYGTKKEEIDWKKTRYLSGPH